MRNFKYWVALIFLFPTLLFADVYEVNFRASEFSNHDNIVVITNVSSLKNVEIDMTEIFNPGLSIDANNPQSNNYSIFSPLATDLGLTYANGTPSNYPKVIDIQGSNIVFQRLQSAVRVHLDGGVNLDYGRKLTFNTERNEIESDVLIAYSDDAFEYATSKLDELRQGGRNVSVIRATGETFPEAGHAAGYSFISFSNSILSDGILTTKGGLFSEAMLDNDGNSIVRKEDDGSIHLGKNSVRIFDSEIHPSGNDVIDSSINRLQIGSNPEHRTIIEGTLEIPEPTQPNHAATKNYVDSNFSKKKYVDSGLASAIAMTSLPQASNGESMVGVGIGRYGSSSAIAVGLSTHISKHKLNINANLGYATGGKAAIGLGAGWRFK